MSQRVLREPGLMVADNVLPAATFESLCREVAEGQYRWVHAQKWDKAWRLWDGHPLRGESVYYDPNRLFGWKGAIYPTSTPLDLLIDAVRQASAACRDITGTEGADWVALYLSPWLYPVGSALSLHQDGDAYSGSFTFFAHARWSVHWGGELLVSRVSSGTATQNVRAGDWVREHPWIAADGADDDHDPGIATCITPQPNRLVLIGPDRPHRVVRVDQNAGAHARASIAGFFLRPR